MTVQCEACEGYGQVISDRSIRFGHTHGNDPDREDVECQACEGEGKREATAADFDGERVNYRWLVGHAFLWNGRLCVEKDDGLIVVNVQPSELEIARETPAPH